MGKYKCSERTHRKIYNAARELFAEKGYDATSLIDIANKAEVSVGTLYRHYPAKQYLLLYAADDALASMRELIDDFSDDMSCYEKTLAVMSADLRGCLEVFDSKEALSEDSIADDLQYGLHLEHRSAIYSSPTAFDYAYKNRAAMKSLFEGLLAEGVRKGELPDGTDVADFADILVAVFFRQYDLALFDPDGDGSLGSLERKLTFLFGFMKL